MAHQFQILIKPYKKPAFYFREQLSSPQKYANLAREWVYKLSMSFGGSISTQCVSDCDDSGRPRVLEEWFIDPDSLSVRYLNYNNQRIFFAPSLHKFDSSLGDPTE